MLKQKTIHNHENPIYLHFDISIKKFLIVVSKITFLISKENSKTYKKKLLEKNLVTIFLEFLRTFLIDFVLHRIPYSTNGIAIFFLLEY